MSKYAPKPKAYVDGETFKIFGRELRLKVLLGDNDTVESDEVFITLVLKNPEDFNKRKKIMDKWLNAKCGEMIKLLCEALYPKFQKYGVEFPVLRFRHMISRWGSCQPKRKVLTFNYALVELPIACIEYVITHEFTHFLQPNHSRKFYLQMAMFMPDWENRKRILEKEGKHVIM